MNKKDLQKLISAGVFSATLLAGAAYADNAPATGASGKKSASVNSADKTAVKGHDCAGKNGCKGQGGCKTGDNGCSGKNSCAGKGGCASSEKSMDKPKHHHHHKKADKAPAPAATPSN